MQPEFDDVPANEWLLIRILAGRWVAASDRPFSSEFKISLEGPRPELGRSGYVESQVQHDQVLTATDVANGWGMIRLPVAEIVTIEGLFVVKAPNADDAVVGHAHAEVRAGSRLGGKQIGGGRRDKLAAIAGRPECIVHRPSPGGSEALIAAED